MSNVANSPTAGRYQTRMMYLHNSAVDLTGVAADVAAFPVVHDKIEILGLGYHTLAASGAVTTPPELVIDKTLAGTSTRAQVGTIEATLAASVPINTNVFFSFDANAAVNAYSGLQGAYAYPTAVKGDVLHIEHSLAGVGGTQSVKPYILYREFPV